jgi:hypothetical protein
MTYCSQPGSRRVAPPVGATTPRSHHEVRPSPNIGYDHTSGCDRLWKIFDPLPLNSRRTPSHPIAAGRCTWPLHPEVRPYPGQGTAVPPKTLPMDSHIPARF